MMFTGKNKEQFEKWLEKTTVKVDGWHLYYSSLNIESQPFILWSAIATEYLDDLSTHIEVTYEQGIAEYEAWLDGEEVGDGFNTRQEALTEAFKKADELINNK